MLLLCLDCPFPLHCRVKITFKTLQQKQFFIEAEPTETVSQCSHSDCVGPRVDWEYSLAHNDTYVIYLDQTQLMHTTFHPPVQILDVKKKIQQDQGFTVESQKIIFSGAYSSVGSRLLSSTTIEVHTWRSSQVKSWPMTRL